ncbi:hypothetical protein [Porphyromonas asaccharolytica]
MNKKRIPPQGTSSEEPRNDDYAAMKARILELEKALHQACLERDVFKTCLEVYGEEQKKVATRRDSRARSVQIPNQEGLRGAR